MSMDIFIIAVVFFAYISLLLELTLLHVPSVASGVNILRPKPEVINCYSAKFRRLFELPWIARVAFALLPILVIYAVFAYPLLVAVGALPPPVKQNLVFSLVGVCLVLLGRTVTFTSVLLIRKQNRQTGNDFKLHTHALFAFSRNPGLIGMYLLVLGFWFMLPSLWFLAGIFFYITHMHLKVLMEEDFLGHKFGENYLEYKRTTRRYC